MQRYVIVGGTSSIAEHCARLWLEKGPLELWLVGRDGPRTEAVAADLRIRSPESTVHVETSAFLEPRAIAATVTRIADAGPIDCVLIAHGSLPDQQACQRDLSLTCEQLSLNGVSPALFAEAFTAAMEHQDVGQIAVIGSVAGDRGRKSNYVYGAAKGLVDRYVQGLQHRFAHTSLHFSLIKPGPTLTPMTEHLADGTLTLADVSDVAKVIVQGLEKKKPIIYAPGRWALVMLIIRHLPRFIFNRLDI